MMERRESNKEWILRTGIGRYCVKHKSVYDVNIGCKQCIEEKGKNYDLKKSGVSNEELEELTKLAGYDAAFRDELIKATEPLAKSAIVVDF
jgi:hypothetical protein